MWEGKREKRKKNERKKERMCGMGSDRKTRKKWMNLKESGKRKTKERRIGKKIKKKNENGTGRVIEWGCKKCRYSRDKGNWIERKKNGGKKFKRERNKKIKSAKKKIEI